MHRFTYTSPSGQTLDLDCQTATTGIGADIRGNEWAYDLAQTGAVSGIARAARTVNMSVIVMGKDEADTICQTFEYDVAHYDVNGAAVLIAWDEWEQRALVMGVTLDDLAHKSVKLSFTVLLLDGVWRKVTEIHLEPGSGGSETTTGLDYPTDFEFDFAGTSINQEISSLQSGGCKVGVIFFGACTNPYVRIGSYTYGVNATAAAGERIVIDPTMRHTVGKSIYKVGQFGEITNLYDARRRGAENSGLYVFQPLEAGTYQVSWPQTYGVTLRLIEERGVLPWN